MIEYAKFLSKRILQRKSNLLMILTIFIIVSVCFVMNIRTQDRFLDKVNNQIQTDNEHIELYQGKLKTIPKNSEEYEAEILNMQLAQESKNQYQQILKDINANDWDKVYDNYANVLNLHIAISKESEAFGMLSAQTKELTYFNYLKEHQLDYEDQEFQIFGLSFTTSMAQFILPVLITVACVYFLTQIFTVDYMKGINLSKLYPLSRNKTLFTKLIVGISFSILTYFLVIFFTFALSSIFNWNAGLQYPILIENQNGIWNAIPVLEIFKNWFVLGFFFYIAITLFVYLLSLFIREDVYLLLTALSLILGISYLPTILNGMMSIAHLLPTTYMNYANVANGYLTGRYMNTSITTSMGIGVLSIFTLIQFLLCILYTKIETYMK